MEVYLLDNNFKSVKVIDSFESLIWAERYFSCGDFELYTAPTDELMQYVKDGYYIWNRDSEYTMIIENIELITDVEEGNHIKISGRSLESILDRRIIWNQTLITGNLQNGVKKILNENIISPTMSVRKIENFIFEDSIDPLITGLTISSQYTGDNIYEIMTEISNAYGIGFKVVLNDSNKFVFKLYSGKDRSFNQTANPYVIFSPKFDNIINSNYLESSKILKNVNLVAGEDQGSSRKTAYVGTASGLERREMYTDARDIRSEVDGRTLTPSEYNTLLIQRGKEKLTAYEFAQSFDSHVDSDRTYIYGKDYDIGDIVQIVNEYGVERRARVTETIRAQDIEGYEIYPNFSVLD